MKVRQIKENIDAVEGYRSRRDAYQRDYDSSVSGMGRRQSQAYQDDGGANDERHDLDPTDWYVVKDGKMFKVSVYPNQEREAISRGYSRTRDEAKAKAADQGVSEMDAPGQIMNATGDKVTIDNKDGTQTIAPKASLTRDPTGKGFVLSKTPTAGGEKPDEPKPGETVFKPATTEGTEKMNEAIRILRLAGLHKAADKLMEQQLFENPWEGNDPAKAKAWASMSPADQKWLGGADPTDPMILARAPNKGKAAAPAAPAVSNPQNPGGMSDEEMLARQNPGGMSDEEMLARQQAAPQAASPAMTAADQDDADMGAAMRANAAGGNSTSAATGVGIPGEEAAAQAAADKAMAPGAQDDVTGVDAAVAANAAKPAGGAAASPAAPAKPKATPDPKVMAMQQELIKKGAKIKADGIMGPATQTAMRTYGSTPGAAPLPAGVTPSTAGAGRGGQGGPTAAQMQAAPRPGANQPAAYNAAKDSQAANVAMAAKPAAGQAASPAAPQPGVGQKGPTKAAAAGQDPSNPLNKAPVAGQPVPPKPGKAVAANGQISDTPAAESIREADNILLNKMLSIAKLR
jgi:hypothetical protein